MIEALDNPYFLVEALLEEEGAEWSELAVLADDLAERVVALIRSGVYQPGELESLLEESRPNVLIDFTVPDASVEIVQAAAESAIGLAILVVLGGLTAALSSLIIVFTIPLITNLALQHFLGQSTAIALPVGQTMLQIFLITLLPVAIGMIIRDQFPTTARRLEKQVGRLSFGLLALIIGLLLVREGSKLPGFLV